MPDAHGSTRVIGLIGGMSWESSALYYRLINEGVKQRLGGHRNARSVMLTVDFHEIELLQRNGDWQRMSEILATAASQLQAAGAEAIVLCTNTMHKVADAIVCATSIPLIHIVDATASAIMAGNHKRVGLLGTKFTMEDGFYQTRMREKFGIEVITPDDSARDVVHSVIYDELCHGVIREASRAAFLAIIADLESRGASSVILGCTEIELLLTQSDCHLQLHPSTQLHALSAINFALP